MGVARWHSEANRLENREHIGEKRTGVALCPTHFSGVNQTFSQ